MKSLRSTRVRLSLALAIGLAGIGALASSAMADPSDPVCIMPPEDYCSYMEGHTIGTPQYRECYQRASALHYGVYCNPVGAAGAVIAKLD